MDEHYLGEHYQDGGEVEPPQKTVKAYKLFRTSPKSPGQLFPLFVDANTPVPIGKWVAAKAGDPGKDPKKVKSKLGDLAYRPGWHAGDLPVATHIGGKSSPDLKAPDYRPDNHVWAEVEMPDDVDWQSVANSRMEYTKAGVPKPVTAHITDQVPFGGHYRYKTNPNMTGNWMIGGSMKVNRVLGDDEVKAINDANGAADLPRRARADGGQVDDGITAYHGSPHEFEQFDTSKIGTGEGAQAYGHGLYFAQAEPTAIGYRDKLTQQHDPRDAINDVIHQFTKGKVAAPTHENIKSWMADNPPLKPFANDERVTRRVHEIINATDPDDAHYSFKELDNLLPDPSKGHMYEVHINAHPHHMLDWDKPLSEQSEHVQGALKNWELNYVPSHLTGGRLVEEMQKGFGEKGASEALAKAGIKGIKYLDAGSRNNKAEPTHNYVVFDHNDVQIKRKYEQGGAVEGFADGGVIPHGDPRREENLAKWHRGSHPATKNPDGTPKVFYHGTLYDFSAFDPAKKNAQHRGRASAIFASPDPKLANHFASPDYPEEGDKPNVMPVHVSTKNPFDYENPTHVKNALSSLTADKDFMDFHREEFRDYIKGLSQGDWRYIEDPWVQDHIRENHDGFFAKGNGTKFVAVYNPEQIKSATGNQGTFDPSNPDITKADGGDVWDDSRVRRSGEGGQETALDFIQNAPLYKQRMEAQAPQPAPAAAPSTEVKPMPVTAALPPAIVQPAQPVQQKQEVPQAQGQVGLYAVGTNDPNPDMTVQSAQRIIESSRAMGINPVFLLPNQAGGTQYAKNSKALQDYLDSVGIQYQMPQYGDKDPLHMTPSWASGAAKSFDAPFLAGDSNSVRLGIVGYGAKGDGKTIVHPESGAVLGRVGANSKAVADELEKYLRWQQQNRTQRNTGGRVHFDVGGFADPRLTSLSGVQSIYTEDLPMPGNTISGVGVSSTPTSTNGAINGNNASNALGSVEPFNPEGGGGGGAESGGPGGSQGSAGGGQPGGGGDGMGSFSHGGRTYYNTGGPVNVSKGQDTAGNFKKKHEKIHGIPVAVEVKEGQDRVKYEPDGSLKFKAKQYADYGAILGTKDADGMNTDVMVGPHKDSDKAYIIDQRKHSTGKFDEHKVMLGFNKRKKAIKAYTKSYADRHGKDRVQDVIKTDIAGLKKWLKHGNLKVAAAKDALINRALEVVSKKT